jgi:hypothetical protein
MSNHDDFNFEPIKGLPERLPEGEHILWQGRPSTRALAREALSTRTVAVYFLVIAAIRVAVSTNSFPMKQALGHAVPILLVGLVCVAILYGIAFVQARATVYTLTNKRVGMRIGAALSMTLNLPYTWIGVVYGPHPACVALYPRRGQCRPDLCRGCRNPGVRTRHDPH